MRDQLVKLRAISVAVILLVAALGASSRETKDKDLPNFHQVNEQLYRGAQPLQGGAAGLKSSQRRAGREDSGDYQRFSKLACLRSLPSRGRSHGHNHRRLSNHKRRLDFGAGEERGEEVRDEPLPVWDEGLYRRLLQTVDAASGAATIEGCFFSHDKWVSSTNLNPDQSTSINKPPERLSRRAGRLEQG